MTQSSAHEVHQSSYYKHSCQCAFKAFKNTFFGKTEINFKTEQETSIDDKVKERKLFADERNSLKFSKRFVIVCEIRKMTNLSVT